MSYEASSVCKIVISLTEEYMEHQVREALKKSAKLWTLVEQV
jgi:hypothetical protein